MQNTPINFFTTVLNLADGDFQSDHLIKHLLSSPHDRLMGIPLFERHMDGKDLVVEVFLEENIVKYERISYHIVPYHTSCHMIA